MYHISNRAIQTAAKTSGKKTGFKTKYLSKNVNLGSQWWKKSQLVCSAMIVYKNKDGYALLNLFGSFLLCYSLALCLLSDLLRVTICVNSNGVNNTIKSL